MSHVEKCPVCNGKCKIFLVGDSESSITKTVSKICQRCNGTGVISNNELWVVPIWVQVPESSA